MSRRLVALFAVAAPFPSGCTGHDSASPILVAPGPAPAIYAGSIQDSVSGTGTLRLSLGTAAGVTAGTWNATFNGRSEPPRVISGTVTDGVLTATVHPDQNENSATSGCTSSTTATLSATEISGTYSAFAVTPSCPTAPAGRFTAAKQ